jgi:hypothetical protein
MPAIHSFYFCLLAAIFDHGVFFGAHHFGVFAIEAEVFHFISP